MSNEQERVIDNACALKTKLYRIGGYAGTGKTHVTRIIVERLRALGRTVLVGSYTGKAASVLNRKGLSGATTLHRMIYHYDEDRDVFYKKEALDADVIVIDEASMLSSGIWHDLVGYGLNIILVGDPGQLEPIGDDPGLMRTPDIVLEKIWRYDDNIALFAERIRKENFYDMGLCGTNVHVLRSDAIADHLEFVDTWIVGFNKTRVAMNKWIRKKEHPLITVGDKMVVLVNNYKLGVYNGQTFVVGENGLCHMDDGTTRTLPLWTGNIGKEYTVPRDKQPGRSVICDYGWCLTCHKMQGSQDRRIGYIDENDRSGVMWDSARHRYTGITRAEEEIKVFI